MAVAIVLAAGRGERLGLSQPKALVPLAGRPMLEWSLAALAEVSEVTEVVLALPGDLIGAAPAGVRAVAGGAVRSDSVRRALRAVTADATAGRVRGTGPAEVVIVHDAARPLAEPELFRRALAELESSGADAVIAAARVSDTIKQVADDGASIVRTLARDRLWAVQTPQVFRREPLEAALEAATEQELAAATDDAWLIEQRGGIVRVCEATPSNLKITTALDLRLAGLLLAERVGGGA